ncbi:ATP-binding protein [Paenibacillus planticolens]|nr:ATP-binding protein [Paenibacillus planticolens]
MKKKVVLGIAFSIFLILQLWCSMLVFHFPYMGIENEEIQGQWVVKRLLPEGAAIKLDLKVGDIILQIDGKPAEDFVTLRKWSAIEQAQSLVVSREGHEHQVVLNAKSNIFYDIFPLIEEMVCFGMAIVIVIKMFHSKSAKLLAAVFLCGSIVFMSLLASIRGDVLGKVQITTFMMLLPIVFLHFLIVFFKEKSDLNLPSWILKYLYSIVVIALCLRGLYFHPSLTYTFYRYDIIITLGFFIFGFLLNMYVLTKLLIKVRGQQSYISSIVKSVWLSWMISFLPIICFSFLPQLLTGEPILNAIFTSWILLVFPMSFAYLIASNQLYDFGLVIRRIMFAGLLAILPVCIFTGVYHYLFNNVVDEKQLLYIFGGSMFLITVALYGAEYWTTKLEPFLFPRKHIFQTALKKISKNLGTISSFRELKDIVLVDIVSTLQVAGGAIIFQYKDEVEIIYEGEIDIEGIRRHVDANTLITAPNYTSIEMNNHESYSSYLIVTRKKTNTYLSREEKQWLQLITSYLEVSLENVHLIRKLTLNLQQFAAQLPHETNAYDIQWFRKVMFDLQEEERMRIATDLHDTTMQDLFFLKRRISSIAEKGNLDKLDQEQLNSMNNFVDMINASLRQSCFELNPHLLKEIGLIPTLKMYVDKESYTTPFMLSVEIGSVITIEEKDLLTKRHIFRIVQELLNNAKKHSQAGKVLFSIEENENYFCLNYEDDGVGFNGYQEGFQKEIGASGMGIEQMKSRIMHMGGQVDMTTDKGIGTTFKIRIPIGEVRAS